MDQDTIKNFKVLYRNDLVRKMICNYDLNNYDFKLNIFDSITLIRKFWAEVSEDTITKCFIHSKLLSSEAIPGNNDALPLPFRLQKFFGGNNGILEEIKLNEYVDIDHKVLATGVFSERDILEKMAEDSEEENVNEEAKIHAEDAYQALNTFMKFYNQNPPIKELKNFITKIEEDIEERVISQKKRQKKITDYFLPLND